MKFDKDAGKLKYCFRIVKIIRRYNKTSQSRIIVCFHKETVDLKRP